MIEIQELGRVLRRRALPARADRARTARMLQVAAVILVAGCGPVPGGSLDGVLAPVPPDWSAVLEEGRGFCEVESRPQDPHSIQLDCFVDDGELFVQSHRWAFASWWPVESWAAIWSEQPEVRVHIGEQVFELTAVRVTDPDRRQPILAARGYDPIPEGIALFRFEPRMTLAPALARFCSDVATGAAEGVLGSMAAAPQEGYRPGCYEGELERFLERAREICATPTDDLEARLAAAHGDTVQTCAAASP